MKITLSNAFKRNALGIVLLVLFLVFYHYEPDISKSILVLLGSWNLGTVVKWFSLHFFPYHKD